MFTSIAQNFYNTGADEALFRVPGGTATATYNFADLKNLEALSNHLKERGSIGSTTGERSFGDGLLTQLARHPANPLQLFDNGNYVVMEADHFVVEYGTTNGVSSVWDAVIAPHLKNYGISTDPGHVERNAPDGIGVQPPAAGGPDDPALKVIGALQAALRKMAPYRTTGESIDNPLPVRRLDETPVWTIEVAPLLKNPFIS